MIARFIGGPLDGKREQTDEAPAMRLFGSLAPNPCSGDLTRLHIYTLDCCGGNKAGHATYRHQGPATIEVGYGPPGGGSCYAADC